MRFSSTKVWSRLTTGVVRALQPAAIARKGLVVLQQPARRRGLYRFHLRAPDRGSDRGFLNHRLVGMVCPTHSF